MSCTSISVLRVCNRSSLINRQLVRIGNRPDLLDAALANLQHDDDERRAVWSAQGERGAAKGIFAQISGLFPSLALLR